MKITKSNLGIFYIMVLFNSSYALSDNSNASFKDNQLEINKISKNNRNDNYKIIESNNLVNGPHPNARLKPFFVKHSK